MPLLTTSRALHFSMSVQPRRSSTRRQVLPGSHETDHSKGGDMEIEAQQLFNLEGKEREIWDEVRDEHYDSVSS